MITAPGVPSGSNPQAPQQWIGPQFPRSPENPGGYDPNDGQYHAMDVGAPGSPSDTSGIGAPEGINESNIMELALNATIPLADVQAWDNAHGSNYAHAYNHYGVNPSAVQAAQKSGDAINADINARPAGDYSGFDVSKPNYGLNASDFGNLLTMYHQTGSNLAGLKSTFAQGTTIPDALKSFFDGSDGTGEDGMGTVGPAADNTQVGQILAGLKGLGGGTGAGNIYNILTGGNTQGDVKGANDSSKPSLLDSLLPYLISGGAALGGGLLDRQSAKDAAQIQADAAIKAAQLQRDTAADSLGFAKDVYTQNRADNAPFLAGATNALSQVQGLIAPGGALSKDFVAPTKEEVQQSPGYQLELDAANKALGIQSRGVTSGATIKAADRYVTDYADTKYDNATNRALNIFQTNRSNRLNPLMQIAGYGPAAVAQNANSGNSASSTVSGINSNMANQIGNLNNQSAYQTASGNVAGTNAVTNALTQIANLAIRKTA